MGAVTLTSATCGASVTLCTQTTVIIPLGRSPHDGEERWPEIKDLLRSVGMEGALSLAHRQQVMICCIDSRPQRRRIGQLRLELSRCSFSRLIDL